MSAGIPTLIYNCAKLPAICQNVAKSYPLDNSGGPGRWGKLLGNDHISLTFDLDSAAKDRRRKAAGCDDDWKKGHICPETDQPRTVPKGASYGDGSYVARKFNPAPDDYTIADANGQYSGLIWTCEEFPPAT